METKQSPSSWYFQFVQFASSLWTVEVPLHSPRLFFGISNTPFMSTKEDISSITVVTERPVPVRFLVLCDSREPLGLET